jgi:isoleucyl-tRNA synthetase
VLDRYLLAKTREVLETVQTHFDEFDTPFAAAALRDFGDVLTNWYVRRSRDRFWTGTDADAFDTLYTVLVTVSQVAAPLLPLVTEEIYRGLTGERSVHLSDWPNAAKFPRDPELVAAMDRVREIASSGLALRKARGLRVRLPLAGAEIVTNDSQELEAFAGILTDELNLKSVTFSSLSEAAWADFGIRRRLVVDAKVAGPRYGKQIQQILANAREDRWSVSLSDQPVMIVDDQNFFLKRDEYELVLDAGRADGAAVTPIPGGGFILIDVEVTPELEAEGIARDLIRQLQELRRSGQFHVSDRVAVAVAFEDSDDLLRLEPYRSSIAAETLSTVSFQRRDTFPLGIELLSQPQGLYNEIEAGKVGNTGKIVTEITGLERA